VLHGVIHRRRRTLVVVLLATALSACGSTASQPTAGGEAGANDELGQVETGDGNGSLDGDSAGSASGTGQTDAGGRGSTGVAGPGAANSSSAPAGVKGGTVTIGVRHADEASATAIGAALGARNVSSGDTRGYAEAVINYINAQGGVAGRRLEAVYQAVDLVGLVANAAAADQASCSFFTEDAKVFAVTTSIPSGEGLSTCLAQRETPLVMATNDEYDQQNMDDAAGWFYLPSVPNLTRAVRIVVDGLFAQGYYQPGTRLGVVRFNAYPAYQRAAEALRAALARHGVTIEEDAGMSSYTSSQEYQSAVLRMKAKNITHVQFIDVSGLMAIQFMQHAESQLFRPRYGLSTGNSLAAVVASAPPAQLRRALAIGWMPSLDVDAAHDPGGRPGAAQCLQIIRAAGLAMNDRIAETLALWTCDSLFFLKAALDAAPDVSAAGFRAGAERLAGAYQSASAFATFFGPGRYDGVAAARNLVFDDGCSCFVYRGPSYAVN
jgi:ABC-type branched-subunit amino acid transport system substrate-binding protein